VTTSTSSVGSIYIWTPGLYLVNFTVQIRTSIINQTINIGNPTGAGSLGFSVTYGSSPNYYQSLSHSYITNGNYSAVLSGISNSSGISEVLFYYSYIRLG